MDPGSKKRVLRYAMLVAAMVLAGLAAWWYLQPSGPGDGFASGNGRIEAVEVDVATKTAGRIREVLADEGDFVKAGQPLARMDTEVLQAQRAEAAAQLAQARAAVDTSRYQVGQRESEYAAARATVTARASERDAATKRLHRSEALAQKGSVSIQALDDARTEVDTAKAALLAAQAQLAAGQAAIETARAQMVSARAGVDAATATITRIDADITDSTLNSPRDGRVQFRVAQPGEILAAGGKVLNLIDLGDVYMTFFLPETVAGRVALGSDARIVLDVAPEFVIPATISYVASTAQFTPKTVETASERQKLMFRVKAQIDRELLQRHLQQVKTGLPGVAWVKLDPQTKWPTELTPRVPK